MPSLSLNNVSIDFPVYGTHATSFKQTLAHAATGGRVGTDTGVAIVHALRDVTLDFCEGDRVGLIGHNGSGKSTLLRVLAGVYPPSDGTFRSTGSVASLIDPTLGIEPEGTGRENIYLRGLIMGLSRSHIETLYDDIYTFSGLGDYLALPVRTYSTGMLMRLAFSIATCIRSDILLMDEWLSVGDVDFQAHAEQRLRDVVEGAGILVLATHSIALVHRECNKLVELTHGRVTTIKRL
jgi:lipopolysaccharide transport system ATP-binding protein